MNDTPYLSVVATSRNDDHGGNLALRMQLFVQCLAAQAQRHRLKTELILVEWNPPANRPRLREVLRFDARHPFCSVRIVEVPAAIHARYRHAQTLPVYQMIAKNVGIRRARGRFVLATNVDIVFSDPLFARLAGQDLQSGRCYRSIRHDVDNALTSEMPVEAVLDYCKSHLIRVNQRDCSLNVRDGSRHVIYRPEVTEKELGHPKLFTNGCGDFTLLSQEDWCRLRGYAELDMFSFHLDSLFLHCAYYAGITECVFPDDHVHYHIEHQEGWTPEIHRDRTLDARLDKGQIDRLDNASLRRLLDRMRDERKPLIFNEANWGLANDQLAEEHVTIADWERKDREGVVIAIPSTRRCDDSKDAPYLSVVVTTRNDDHGGNHLQRFQTFLDHLADMCARHRLGAELIVVEWNPDPSRPSLAQAMRWPDPSRLASRVIVVPPEIHRSYRNSEKFPLFQMIAKNVGIRRARGQYVLATNMDVLFSHELASWLARRELREDCVYRIDRHDVGQTTIPAGLSRDEVLDFCARHVVRVHGQHGTHAWGDPPRIGDPDRLHSHACGDFTLMARTQWERLKGYPEFPLWSIYLDGLLLHAARAVGLEQRILREPLRLYHIEHSLGWAVTQDTIKERPSLDYQKEYLPLCQQMLRTGKALDVNPENWGLKDRSLAEYEPGVRGSQTACAAEERTDGLSGEIVRSWIDRISSTENRLYYRDQSAQTLIALARYARTMNPTVVVELGTLAGLSLRTWIAATERARIYAIDLSFQTLKETGRVLPLDLSRVTLLEQDILKTDFASLWTAQDRVIFFVDAHDLPGVPIMEHVLTTALPALPDGSLVVVDDLWFSTERLTRDNARSFLDNRVVGEIDELQCFEGHYAPYHGGGSFMGFAEVIPLLKFVNAHRIPLVHEKGGKQVSFAWRSTLREAWGSRQTGSTEPAECYGSVSHNPLASVPVPASLRETMDGLAQDYRQKKIVPVAERLAKLLEQYPNDPGLSYALAVCLARCRELTRARDILGRVVRDSADPRCRRLFNDLVARVGPGHAAPSPVAQVPPQDREGLTIFAMPKPFEGHIATIQKNAIRSWARLRPAPQIILFGDEPGTRQMAQEVGACHVPDIERNEFGTPLVNKLFEAAQEHASHRIVAYVNADILLFGNFVRGVQEVRTHLPKFLLIGQRWDLTVLDEIDFDRPDWQSTLEVQMQERAMLHGECGLDYFVFPKGVYTEIPPFAIGRIAWDNWLVMAPHRAGVPVVDGTEFITVVHQDHDYGHVAGGRRGAWTGVEASRNRALAGKVDDSAYTSGAEWILRRDGRLTETAPREPVFSSASYREYRHAWLAKEARRLMALDRMELAAAKWEETLPILERLLIAARGKRSSPDSDGVRLAECYATACVSLAQCHMQLGCHDRVVADYTRLLETSLFEIPQKQRDDIQRVCDRLRERLPQSKAPLAHSPGDRQKRSAPAQTVQPSKQGRATRPGQGEKRLALIVSIPDRADDLRCLLVDIEDQVDDIRILLNEYETVPEDLYRFAKVSRIEASPKGELYASGAWDLLMPDDDGYVLVLDDDIKYPPDYADTMIAKIEEHQRRAVVVVHGMDFRPPFADFVVDRNMYHFETACRQDRVVHAGGVGTLVFHTSTIRPQSRDFPNPSFRDLWFAVLAAKREVPIVCIARDAGWLLARRMRGRQLWRMACEQGQRDLKNEVFRTRLLPSLNIDVLQTHAADHRFSIFCFTNGRSTFDYCVRSLTDSWDRHEKTVVLRDMDFFAATARCLEDCETPYFFKVDDDFLLHPKAIAYMRKKVLEYPYPEELGIYYCHLWEDWTSRVRQSIKVYRAEALRRIGGFQVNDQGKVDEATKAALERAGFKVVADPSVVALHACGTWEEQLEYERLWSAMADAPYKKPTHDAMKAYCGTKSLDMQYAMRLGTLESINRRLNTPFHRFLVESSTEAQSTPSPRDGSEGRGALWHGVDSAEAGGSLLHPPSRPRRQRVRDLGSRSVPVRCESRVDNRRPPKVSVVLACRDGERHLRECLDSILKQTLSEWELFLLDDGSTDGTRRVMEEYAAGDARIRSFYFDESAGPYIRRNFAIERARADFIVIHDADDLMCPEKLERLWLAITQDDRLGVVGSFYRIFLDEYQGAEHSDTVVLKTTHEQILEEYRNAAVCDFCWHGSAIIRKRLFEDIGPYDENPFASDSFWLAKVAEYACRSEAVRLMNLPEVLTLRRMHVSSQTGSLPAFDPRSRRAHFKEHRRQKLSELIRTLHANPRADIKAVLRRTVCGDFIKKNARFFPEWENAPLTGPIVQGFLGRIYSHFTKGQFVQCLWTSRIVEQLVEGIAQNVRSYELIKGLAYFALGYPCESRECLDRECDIHRTPVAIQFRADWLDRGNGLQPRAQRLSLIERALFHSDGGQMEPVECFLDSGAKGPRGVSVIVSLAGDAASWPDVIASFDAQTEKDFEVIALVPAPLGQDLAHRAGHVGFPLSVLGAREGVSLCRYRNAAADRARGRHLAFLGEYVVPDRDFVARVRQHFREKDVCGLRGRILCESGSSVPIRFDLGPDPLSAACDIDELCVFDRETFFRLGGFPAVPFDHGAIHLSYQVYADPRDGARRILYCPDVRCRYRGPEEPRAGLVDRFALENRFVADQAVFAAPLQEEQQRHVWGFREFVEGLYPSRDDTPEECFRQSLRRSLFLRERDPRLSSEWARTALRLRPDCIEARCLLGSAQAMLGRPGDACVLLETCLGPLEELIALERLDRARSEFRSYADILEYYVASGTLLAECYMKTGRYDRVGGTYARLLGNPHVHLDPAQRQNMERIRDRLASSHQAEILSGLSRGAGCGRDMVPANSPAPGRTEPRSPAVPPTDGSGRDRASEDSCVQKLTELERMYRSMPAGSVSRHAVASRLAELFRKAGATDKSQALETEARTIGNTLAYENAKQTRPDVCSHRPVIVEFNVITRCNGGCVMCNYGTDGEILDLEQFQRLADEWLPTARDAHLIGGEVLLHPQFYELCEYANRFGVSLGMTTNLSTLAGRRPEAITRFFHTVRVSVDGATRQTYESIRRRLSFERLCENLAVLADIKRGRPELEMELAFVAMRQNIAELPDVIEMAARYAFDSVAVNFVHVYNAQTLDDSLLFHRELANKHLDLARVAAARLGLALDIPDNFDLSRMPYVASQQLTEGHRQCTRPWQRVRLLIHGEVIPCCHLHDLPMGNALTESFEAVWNGEKFRRLRQAIRDSRDEMPERCKHCRILMRGADSNDAMMHVSPALVAELKQRLQARASTPAVTVSAPPAPRTSVPVVSVVLACRNGEKHLPECLDSILQQTLSEWELLLLDDGSTDGTRGIMEEYAARDARIRPFYFDESAGPYVRRNFAIRQARAPFVSIQDADGIMCPDKLRRLYDAIGGDERLAVVGSFYRKFLDDFTGIESTEAVTLPATHEEILEAYDARSMWDFSWHGSAIVRRTLFEEIGLYDENPFGADSFWLAKVAEYARRTERIRLGNIPEFLTLRRVHSESQVGQLPAMDPRSRRTRYSQYCLRRLQEVVNTVARDPSMDVARALRECTCADFLPRFGAPLAEWEREPIDEGIVVRFLQRATECFRMQQYVSCVQALSALEGMDPELPHRLAHVDLVRALALYGLGQKERCQIYLRREMAHHDNPPARQFYDETFTRGAQVDVQRWAAEHADAVALRITDARPWGPSAPAGPGVETALSESPKVTVITACRNAARFLPECLDSILAQTLGQWELFLLDDASTDDTRRIIKEYAQRDARIHAYFFDDQKGPYVRRNFAIERARADFIVIHDADDLMCPTKLETLYDEISRDKQLAMVGSNYRTFLEVYQGPEQSECSQLPLTDGEIMTRFKSWQHGMSHGSAIIRKALFAEIGLYDENPFSADSFWSAKLALYAQAGRPVFVKNVPECLTLIRLHAMNYTRVVSTLDPRNRRTRYRQYCEGRLWRIRERLKSEPGMDIGRALRQCTCGDFLTRFRAQILAWESQPLDDRVVPEYLDIAVSLFNRGFFVSCVNILNNVEVLDGTVPDRVVGYSLLRGLALFALRMNGPARLHLDREIRCHGTAAARRFVKDAFESTKPVDLASWCQEHAERFGLGLMKAGSNRSRPATLSVAGA
ncbi:MAG TPA: glycosyltransferase [Sedimentisphaerales bacterium]|nr:glycosyltransferase [Sedimentisphaerales bacterium]HRS10884.1 glycosyltransferase [Sedimentisphaerales bacterium]HRV47589.1 glycosyltransferase [Sedimentisphaerales bacterium]